MKTVETGETFHDFYVPLMDRGLGPFHSVRSNQFRTQLRLRLQNAG